MCVWGGKYLPDSSATASAICCCVSSSGTTAAHLGSPEKVPRSRCRRMIKGAETMEASVSAAADWNISDERNLIFFLNRCQISYIPVLVPPLSNDTAMEHIRTCSCGGRMLMDSGSRPDLREKNRGGGIVLYAKKYLTFICLHICETYRTTQKSSFLHQF